MLLKIEKQEVYDKILVNIMNKVDETFRNKKRYHSNSQPHRVILTALQHILFIFLLRSHYINIEEIVCWCINLMGSVSHESSVKFYMEWLMALYFCLEVIYYIIYMIVLRLKYTPYRVYISKL